MSALLYVELYSFCPLRSNIATFLWYSEKKKTEKGDRSMRKIILDCDTGTDDAMAIIMAALSKDIDLSAITCVHGNLPLRNTLENTLRVVEMLGIDVPVYKGCPEPMVQHILPGRILNVRGQQQKRTDENGETARIHDEYLPLPKATIKEQPQHAVSFLVDTLRREKLTVVAVGPGTNVAMALRMDPSIAENIEELVIMGGGVSCSNISQAAEANFFWDPEAASILLSAKTKVTVFPLDATTSALFTEADGNDFRAVGGRAADFFGSLIVEFVQRMAKVGISNTADPDDHSCAIHDALCILYLIDPSFVTDIRHETAFVDVSGGFADGMLIVDRRSYFEKIGDVNIAYRVDKQKVKNLILDILQSAN